MMRTTILRATALALLVATPVLALDDPGPELDREAGLLAEARAVRREINLHNLYNGLHLTADQMERLLALARRARTLREECFGSGNARAEEILRTYREILDAVRGGGRIPRALETLGGLMELAEKRLRRRYFDGMAELEAGVWGVLTPAQRDVFKGYDPCLIPPRKLKDPVRVGQAQTGEGEREILALARRLPEKDFEHECRRALEGHLSLLEKFLGRLEAPTRDKELDRMLQVCRRVRPLTDVDFALKADDFARELALDAPKDLFKAKAEEFLDLVRRFQGGSIGKLANHFLDPVAVGVLEKRLERALQGPAGAPRDLAGEEGARPPGTGCALKPGEEGPGLKKKYSVAELVEILDLDAERARSFATVVGQAKSAHFKILGIPMADGRTPFARFLEIQSLPEEKRARAIQDLFSRLQEPIPGRDASHMEYIARIQLSLDRQLRTVLTPGQYERLEARVEDFLEQIEPGGGKPKPHVRELAATLGLDAGQVEEAVKVFRTGQGASWRLLSTPDSSGRKPIEILLALQALPEEERGEGMAKFLAALQGRIPGREESYLQELERIKTEIRGGLSEVFTAEQAARYDALNVDPLDVQLD